MTTKGLHFLNPPVHAVELTIFFEPVPIKLSSVAPMMSELRSRFPSAEERFSRVPWGLETAGPQLVDAGVSDFPFPWLTFSNNDGRSVSFQDDRFMLGWEFNEGSLYPGYATLKSELSTEFETFATHVGAALDIRRVRAEYDNNMPPNASWTTAQRAFSIECSSEAKRLDGLEASSVGGQFHLENAGFVTHVDFAARSSNDTEGLSLRSTTHHSEKPELEFDALDEAHAHLIECFSQLTTSSQQKDWGRE